MLQINHTDARELDILAQDLQHTPEDVQEKILNEVLLTGLMNDPAIGGRILQFFVGRKRYFEAALQTAIKQGSLGEIWEATLGYMVGGENEWDKTSAGGWGASELCTFTDILDRHGYEPSPLLVNYQAENDD